MAGRSSFANPCFRVQLLLLQAENQLPMPSDSVTMQQAAGRSGHLWGADDPLGEVVCYLFRILSSCWPDKHGPEPESKMIFSLAS